MQAWLNAALSEISAFINSIARASRRIALSLTAFGPKRWLHINRPPTRKEKKRPGNYMNPQKAETSVQQQIVVEVPIKEAFRIFTEEFDLIKPREHNLLSVDIAETVFEAKEGGDLYDRGVDGSICRFGRVLAFEPPHRFVFSWDIGPEWKIETDLNRTSEVELRFVSETPQRTRVELEHRNIDRHGAGWEAVRGGVGSDEGWPLYLKRFAGLTKSSGS